MSALLTLPDPEGLLEYSVVYTDRSLNHMSAKFKNAMVEVNQKLRQVYGSDRVIIVPGNGTTGMEAVARQFAQKKRCLIIRNGWFSYRWSQILETARITDQIVVMKAEKEDTSDQPAFHPTSIEKVKSQIESYRPDIVFAPHVETSAGVQLPDGYLKELAASVHGAGGLLAVDCIASGTYWLNQKEIGADIVISAPQKGWSSTPCCALVMLNDKAARVMEETTSDSFAIDLKKWGQIMDAYLAGNHAYHATMPTDGIQKLYETIMEMEEMGFEKVKELQIALGGNVRRYLKGKGQKSVAGEGFEASGVVVIYTRDDALHNGSGFAKLGMQIAAGVPLQCDEPAGYKTFRLGLFGVDKLKDIDAAQKRFEQVFDKLV